MNRLDILVKKLLPFLIVFSATLCINAKVTPVPASENGKWGYKDKETREWLLAPIYDGGWKMDFKDNDYAIVSKNGKQNVINLNLSPILPDWYKEVEVADGFIIATKEAGKKAFLFDMNGKQLYEAYQISFIKMLVKTNGKSELSLIGFQAKLMSDGNYVYLGLDRNLVTPLVSDEYIWNKNGVLHFVKTKKSGFDVNYLKGYTLNVDGEVIDEVEGFSTLGDIQAGNHKLHEFDDIEALYDGYIPVYLACGVEKYKSKGKGVLLGHEVVKESKFDYTDYERKHAKEAKKNLMDPQIAKEYKERVIEPLRRKAKQNKEYLSANKVNPSDVKVSIIPYGSGFAFSNDGKTLLPSNQNIYEAITPVGNKGMTIGVDNGYFYLMTSSGIPLTLKEEWTEMMPTSEKGDFLIVRNDEGKAALMKDSGEKLTAAIFDDILVSESEIGEVIYAVIGNKWSVWNPIKGGAPKIGKYHYISMPDKNGVVQVKYNGFPGSINLKTGEGKGPVETLFDSAYNNESMAPEKRISLYLQAIELDKELQEGYIGSALNNIGAIYEDAGDEDTAFAYYERSMNNGNKTGEKNFKRIRNNRRLDRIATIANAVADISGTMANSMGAIYGITPPDGEVFNSGYGNFSSDSSSSSSSYAGGYSSSFYREQYANWERRAQSAYESLTNLGYRTKKNGQETSGSTASSMSSSNYTRQKKCLRDAQHEMQSIRQKARKDGVDIPQSHWETVTVSY